MASYKEPSFNERTAAAREARERALKLLAAKPAPDPVAAAARAAAAAEKAAARSEAMAQTKADKIAAREAAAQKSAAAIKPKLTPEEEKALRDARYAARKNRK
jgi:hypothetical protein